MLRCFVYLLGKVNVPGPAPPSELVPGEAERLSGLKGNSVFTTVLEGECGDPPIVVYEDPSPPRTGTPDAVPPGTPDTLVNLCLLKHSSFLRLLIWGSVL